MRRGAAAARLLAEGAELRDVLDVGVPAAWLELDAGVRWDQWYYAQYILPAWEHSTGGRTLTAALRSGAPLTESQLALALCHRDGRIRGAVLGRVRSHPALLPLLVLRCSDWAKPVRDEARGWLGELLDAERAATLLPLIVRVGWRQRGDFGAELADRLLRAAPRDLLTPLYTDPDREVRRFAYRLAVEQRLLSPAELACAAARDTDAVVQSLCADAVVAAVAEGEDHDDVLAPLLGARSPQARAAGVTALRRAGRPEQAVGFLGDRSALVRACARYVVRQGGIDPLPWYRERCAESDGPAPGAVIGLAECGERGDAEVLWPLLGHPVPAVRARAVAGLRILDVTDVRRLRPLLDDPAPAVVREVTEALLPSARTLDADWLCERLAGRWPRHVRLAAYRLLDTHEGLVRLRAAVALVDDEDARLRLSARQAVRRWFSVDRRRGTVTEVGELLDRARQLLDAEVR
ncbi:hypothetical protein [Streptomyces sp. T028]|uniref:hypothetical protein n=1 Tax=Streptomyces sp. T028 TaxID=3394379 RepID=UPI003A8B3F6B